MYCKANWDDIHTETRHLSEIFYLCPDIYTVEDHCLFVLTSIENLMQKIVPSR